MSQLPFIDKVRSILAKIWQRTEIIIKIAIKFFAYYYMFKLLANAQMFSHLPDTFIFKSNSVHLVLALVSTLLPNRSGVLLAVLMIIYSVFQTSFIGAALVALALILLYVAASSLFPEYVYLVPLMAIAVYKHFYLAVPLFCGMYIGAVTVVPVVIGIITVAVFNAIPLFMDLQMGALDALPKLITDASKNGISTILSNDQLIYLMVVSSVIILLGALLTKLKVNFARYIALGVSGIFGLVAFTMGVSQGRIEAGEGSVLITSLLVLAVFLILELLKVSVSYEGSQSLEFEDENYLYQVRMIPKMSKHHTAGEGSDLIIRKAPEIGKKLKKAKKAPEKAPVAEAPSNDRAFTEEDLNAMAPKRDRVLLFGETAPEPTPSNASAAVNSETTYATGRGTTLETVNEDALSQDKTMVVAEDISDLEKTQILEEATRINEPSTAVFVPEEETKVQEAAGPNVRNVLSDDDEPLDLFQEYDEKHS